MESLLGKISTSNNPDVTFMKGKMIILKLWECKEKKKAFEATDYSTNKVIKTWLSIGFSWYVLKKLQIINKVFHYWLNNLILMT